MAALHISISAETLFTFGGVEFSNSMFTSMVVSGLIIIFALLVNAQLTNTSKPTGLQNFAEWLVESLYNLVHGVTGDVKKSRTFFPVVATFFLFIILNNYFGLLPGVGTITVAKDEHQLPAQTQLHEANNGVVPAVHAAETQDAHDSVDHAFEGARPEAESAVGTHTATTDESGATTHLEENSGESHGPSAVPLFRPGTADLNTTLALAIFSVVVTQVFGIQFQQLGYFKKFINFSSPIMFFVGILELISEFAKIISFAFRLFGNIFAGEVLLTVILFLLPLVAPMPFYGLELFVGFIQALVFSMLSLVFFNMATQGHDDH